MKKICVVSGSRAEYGQLRPLLSRLRLKKGLDVELIVTGSHLDAVSGNTQAEIVADNQAISARIPIPLAGDGRNDMAAATGEGITRFAGYFADHRPRFLIVIGDRFETFSAAVAAAMQGIPIAHICGGSATEGAVDEFLRHSITKMSILHFTTCERYRKRVIQLGEDPARVFNVGSLAIENTLSLKLLSREELGRNLEFDISGTYCVVTFHPETLAEVDGESQLGEVIRALDGHADYRYIITMANADAGSRAINALWLDEAKKRGNWLVVQSLGVIRYLSALKYARMMIGNSSSGTTEGPAMHIPVVNIGDRQKGRVMAESVICCRTEAEDISSAILRAGSDEFRDIATHAKNPFGDGHTSERIADIVAEFAASGPSVAKKAFYDIDFEARAI